jgi:hypothetical protein
MTQWRPLAYVFWHWPRAGVARDAYEDWYLLDGFAALGPLNQAAVSEAGGHRRRHDRAADAVGGGVGGLYSVRAGSPRLTGGIACWFAKPARMTYEALDRLLEAVASPADAVCVWQRELALGPGREFCLVAPERLPLPPELDVLRVARAPLPRGPG